MGGDKKTRTMEVHPPTLLELAQRVHTARLPLFGRSQLRGHAERVQQARPFVGHAVVRGASAFAGAIRRTAFALH